MVISFGSEVYAVHDPNRVASSASTVGIDRHARYARPSDPPAYIA
jgi:hypothetical protein